MSIALLIVPFAACNAVLGISEPSDPEVQSGGTAGTTAGTVGSQGGTGASGNAQGGNSGRGQGGVSGTAGLGGAAGESGSGDVGGEAGTSGEIAPVRITTASLPNALVNVRFDFQFRATGGAGRPYVWSADPGSLPNGLELTDDGILHGTTGFEGTFDIPVSVAEEGRSRSDSETFRLQVIRKRWLVYESDEAVQGQILLYAVDVTDPMNKFAIVRPEDPLRHAGVGWYAFSPDGNYLAFTATDVGSYSLHVVDMTRLELLEIRLVDDGFLWITEGSEFSWSPDSRFIAYVGSRVTRELESASKAPTVTPSRLYIADVTQPTSPFEVAPETPNIESVAWASDDLLTYWANGSTFYTRPFVQDAKLERLQIEGVLVQRWPEREIALFRHGRHHCFPGRWDLVDFRGRHDFDDGMVSVSPAVDYVANREIYDGTFSISPPFFGGVVATFPSPLSERNCSPGAWSGDGTIFAAAGEGYRLFVTVIRDGDAEEPRALPGDYGPLSQLTPPAFSPNDGWLGFATETGIFIAERDASGDVGPAVAIDPNAHSTEVFGDAHFSFSPDSAFIAYNEMNATDRKVRALVADLRSGERSVKELALPDVQLDSQIGPPEWSVHSTELAFLAQAAGRAPTEIYLVTQANTSNPVITKLNGPMGTCTDIDVTCRMVWSFAFQP
jgi:hypothetical protein